VLPRLVEKLERFFLPAIAKEDQRSSAGSERLFLQAGSA
jgi:hypothetical protein